MIFNAVDGITVFVVRMCSPRENCLVRWSDRKAVENVREATMYGRRTARRQQTMVEELQGHPVLGR